MLTYHIAPALEDGYEWARAFLNPVLDETASRDARWNPTNQGWVTA
jgi:hypothetical protein